MINQEPNINQGNKGLNDDISSNLLDDKVSYTHALNANLESEDGNLIHLTNEPSNTLQTKFTDLTILKTKFIVELNQTILFAYNNKTNKSEIGRITYSNECVDNFETKENIEDNCETKCNEKLKPTLSEPLQFSTEECNKYETIVSSSCLNFIPNNNENITKIEYQLNHKSLYLFWSDENGMRYIDLYNIPYLTDSMTLEKYLDCNAILINPDFSIPCLELKAVEEEGSLETGSYEYLVAYSNGNSEAITQYYSHTNPVSIWENKYTNLYSFPTNKSVRLTISNLDTRFKYVNVAVIKTVNYTQSYELVGTFDIINDIIEVSHTGNNKQPFLLSENDIFNRKPYYSKAKTLTTQNNILMWGNLTAPDTVNYQKIASQITPKWVAYMIPYTEEEGYKNPMNVNNYRSYLRGEVYNLKIVFELTGGRTSHYYQLVGPSLDTISNQIEKEKVSNEDSNSYINVSNCVDVEDPYYWRIYNTAKRTNVMFIDIQKDYSCYKGYYATGTFGHYISEKTYPNNPEVWGDLANQPIRLFRFPDTEVSPIFTNIAGKPYIHPLGISISNDQIKYLIETSDLTQEQKDEIVGYRILRDTRSGNESIVAKGILYNVGQYQKDNEIELYPNYPFNDLRPDPTLSSKQPEHHSGTNDGNTQPVLKEVPIPFFHTKAMSVPSNYISYPGGNNTIRLEHGAANEEENSTRFDFYGTIGNEFFNIGFTVTPVYLETDGEDSWTFKFEDDPEDYDWDPNTNTGNYYPINLGNLASMASIPGDPKYFLLTVGLSMNRNNKIRKLHTVLGFYFKVVNDKLVYDPSIKIQEGSFSEEVSFGVRLLGINGYETINATFIKQPDFKAEYGKLKLNNRVNKTFSILEEVIDYTITRTDIRLKGFGENSKYRYTFHGPNIHFNKPLLGTHLYIEDFYFGKTKSKITEVLDEPKYSIPTNYTVKIAAAMAASTTIRTNIGAGTFGWPTINFSVDSVAPVFLQTLEMMEKIIPLRKYGYQFLSLGDYFDRYHIDKGIKIRGLDIASYLGTSMQSVGDIGIINNHQRESSVYLKTNAPLPFTHEVFSSFQDNSRYSLSSYLREHNKILKPNEIIERKISSYYGSIRRVVKDQYGEVNSNRLVSLGDCNKLNSGVKDIHIFGGDTFITKFALKRKLPYFLDNRVGFPDKADVAYDLLGNVAYPTYWISSFPIEQGLSQSTINRGDAIIKEINNFKKAGNLIKNFVTGGAAGMMRFINFTLALTKDFVEKLGVKNVNLDLPSNQKIFEEGYFYLFNYGIPYFFVESDVNTDLRQAENPLEKDFFPNVSKDIPTNWLQEKNVPIAHDNYYLYNRDFSKQSLSTGFSSLPRDYNPLKDHKNLYSSRVIYSQTSNIFEEKYNNWLVYKANDYKDFPLTNGELISLESLEQEKVLVRFENNFLVYNAFVQLQTDNKTLITGVGDMFANPAQEYSNTYTGYGGSQHEAFEKSKYGYLWTDAKRGHIFLLKVGGGLEEISRKGKRNWFRENLPFRILKDFPDYNIDNSYKDVGITTVFDNKFERYILTKRDYRLKSEFKNKIVHINGEFFLTSSNTKVELNNSRYFENCSFTIGYSVQLESWISYYSFTPNYYIGKINNFESGINSNNEQNINKESSLWSHLLSNKSYQTFYNNFYNFEIEFIQNNILTNKTLNSVQYKSDVFRYVNEYDYKRMTNITFTEGIIYNEEQTSGLMKFVINDRNNLSSNLLINTGNNYSIVPLSKEEEIWKFNKFYNLISEANSLEPIMLLSTNNVEKVLNENIIDYSKINQPFNRTRLQSDKFKIKLINSEHQRYKYVFNFLINK